MRYALVEEYILKSKDDRQQHIDLSYPCIEIGGTTIPKGYLIVLCHACNNAKCSNFNHLYWGTAKENVGDMIEAGTLRSGFPTLVKKHGLEAAKEQLRQIGRLGGLANKGKFKTPEHRKKVSIAHTGKKLSDEHKKKISETKKRQFLASVSPPPSKRPLKA